MNAPVPARRSAPAALRNREPILAVLRMILPPSGRVLEIASGTGEHIIHFARALPHLEWQPSDPSGEARRSIIDWTREAGAGNVSRPVDLDTTMCPWPITHAAAVLCINMVHISPWEATVGLMRGAASVLARGGPLYLYGPLRRSDRTLEPGNAAFDHDLRMQNSSWGLRELDAVVACAAEHHLTLKQSIEMPANNLSVIFEKT